MPYLQDAFRFYEDGTEPGSVAIASQDTSVFRAVSGDNNLLIRFRVEKTTGSLSSPVSWRLQYSKNSGSWTDVTTTSSNVKAFNSSNLTDESATTERLASGTGTWTAGIVTEDGEVDDLELLTNRYTEFLFAITVLDADVSNFDTLDFRLLRNGSTLDTYTVTPRITVVKSGFGARSRFLLLGVS